jgi:hypothetical protein
VVWRLLRAAVTPVLRKPATALATVLLTGFAAAIVVNALALQPRRHPAPLFGPDRGKAMDIPLKQAPEAVRTAAPALVPAAPPAVLPPARPEREAPPATSIALPPARPDLIGDLLRGGAPATTGHPAGPAQASTTLLNVQRALVKLGYSLKPDGMMGPETQHAIESFEQRSGLPVTGDLNTRMLKSLATASGMPVE